MYDMRALKHLSARDKAPSLSLSLCHLWVIWYFNLLCWFILSD